MNGYIPVSEWNPCSLMKPHELWIWDKEKWRHSWKFFPFWQVFIVPRSVIKTAHCVSLIIFCLLSFHQSGPLSSAFIMLWTFKLSMTLLWNSSKGLRSTWLDLLEQWFHFLVPVSVLAFFFFFFFSLPC